MKSTSQWAQFTTIFRNEVLLNAKRPAPYVLMLLFTAHSVLWWGWGAAAYYGWAVNCDFNIVRNLSGFSFLLGLPIFNAVIMGDPVIRDFRAGIDSLIFSKPMARGSYLLGKFFGNFFVLVCCQSAFVLTMLLLQWFPAKGLAVLPPRVLPFFKPFIVFVVISHLFLAAVYFIAGTLTRNAKIIYGLAASFYPGYIAYQLVFLRALPKNWRVILDPLAAHSDGIPPEKYYDAEWINHLAINYSPVMIANRVVVIVFVAAGLTMLCRFFTITKRVRAAEFSALNLSSASERLYCDSANVRAEKSEPVRTLVKAELPPVARLNTGLAAHIDQLLAALGAEFRLLRSERSLIVIVPLTVIISTLQVAFWNVRPDPTYAAAYATNTAAPLLLFTLCISVFFTVEILQRDCDLSIQPLLWSHPAPNHVFLLSKYLATLLLNLVLIFVVVLTALGLQIVKQNGPVEIAAYARVYLMVVIPNAIFTAAAALALKVVLRDRYLTYVVSIGIAAGLFSFYNQGHTHWLYNPLLYRLWDYESLITGPGQILKYRAYVLALTVGLIGVAHLFYPRKSRGVF